MDFYKKATAPDTNDDKNKDDYTPTPGMEIVLVSSDETVDEFETYFDTMPWLAMKGDVQGAANKHNLATTVKAFRCPILVIVNVKTGAFVTDQARKDILAILEEPAEGSTDIPKTVDAAKAKALLQDWMVREPIAIGSAGGSEQYWETLINMFFFFKANPLYGVMLAALLILTPIIQRCWDNPLLAVAAWYLLCKWTSEKLDRNLPYEALTPSTKKEEEKKKQ